MCECFEIPLHPKVLNVYVVDYGKLIRCEHSQEEILGFSTTRIHNVFSEFGQCSLICNLYGFDTKMTRTFLVKSFLLFWIMTCCAS